MHRLAGAPRARARARLKAGGIFLQAESSERGRFCVAIYVWRTMATLAQNGGSGAVQLPVTDLLRATRTTCAPALDGLLRQSGPLGRTHGRARRANGPPMGRRLAAGGPRIGRRSAAIGRFIFRSHCYGAASAAAAAAA